MKIQLTNVYVKSPIEAFKFYTDVLGFKEQLFMPEADVAIVVSPEEPDGTALLLEPGDNPLATEYQEKLYNAALPAIVLGVKDIQQEYNRLLNKGVKFTKAPAKTAWGMEAVLDDTCGNLIQIVQAE